MTNRDKANPASPSSEPESSKTGTLSIDQIRTLLVFASSRGPVDADLDQPSTFEQVAASRSGAGPDRELVARTLDPSTSLAELRRIKDAAKRSLAEADSTERRDAAALLYNIAVAAAHAHHDASISSLPLADQYRLFSQLADAFDDGQVAELFRAASERTKPE